MPQPFHHRSEGSADRPLYLQLVDSLRDDIARKRPGERIDSEPQLSRRFGVSRFTVTRAIEILADEGLIRRRQGLGSFVAPPPLQRQPSYLASFTEAVAGAGPSGVASPPRFRSDALARGSALSRRGRSSSRLDRLRLVDDVPTAIHRFGDLAPRSRAASGSTARVVASAELLALPPLRRRRARRRARRRDAARAHRQLEEARLLRLGDDPRGDGGRAASFRRRRRAARLRATPSMTRGATPIEAEIRSAGLSGADSTPDSKENDNASDIECSA